MQREQMFLPVHQEKANLELLGADLSCVLLVLLPTLRTNSSVSVRPVVQPPFVFTSSLKPQHARRGAARVLNKDTHDEVAEVFSL